MRALSYILIALGVFLLAHAVYDECRGRTHMPVRLSGRRFNTRYLYTLPVFRANNPELFRKFMTTHWIYAGLIAGAGCGLYLTTTQREDSEAAEVDPDSKSGADG